MGELSDVMLLFLLLFFVVVFVVVTHPMILMPLSCLWLQLYKSKRMFLVS